MEYIRALASTQIFLKLSRFFEEKIINSHKKVGDFFK